MACSKEQSIKNLGNGMTNKKQTDYQKQRMKEIHKGKIISIKQRKQISDTNKKKGLTPPKEFWFKKGRLVTDEEKIQISKIMKGNTNGFQKGQKAWNYIDGRSLYLTTARYGDDWSKIRLIVYTRDEFKCQSCGVLMNKIKKPHHVHHIIPFLNSFDNSLNNLITLCPSCHRKEEVKIMKKLKKQEVIIR